MAFKDRSRLCKEDSEENASSCIEEIIFPSRCSSNRCDNFAKALLSIVVIWLKVRVRYSKVGKLAKTSPDMFLILLTLRSL
jgi:hypothetical protein